MRGSWVRIPPSSPFPAAPCFQFHDKPSGSRPDRHLRSIGYLDLPGLVHFRDKIRELFVELLVPFIEILPDAAVVDDFLGIPQRDAGRFHEGLDRGDFIKAFFPQEVRE